MASIAMENTSFIPDDDAASVSCALAAIADQLMRQHLERSFPVKAGTTYGEIRLEAH